MTPRRSSQRRWITGVVLVAAATGGLYLATRGGGRASSAPSAQGAPQRQAPVAARGSGVQPTRAAALPKYAPDGRKIIPVDLGLADVSPTVKKWKEEGLPGTFREMVAPD